MWPPYPKYSPPWPKVSSGFLISQPMTLTSCSPLFRHCWLRIRLLCRRRWRVMWSILCLNLLSNIWSKFCDFIVGFCPFWVCSLLGTFQLFLISIGVGLRLIRHFSWCSWILVGCANIMLSRRSCLSRKFSRQSLWRKRKLQRWSPKMEKSKYRLLLPNHKHRRKDSQKSKLDRNYRS